ncbi:MAG: NTP transferase domain-containing protein [Clostridiaceae bacterium]
MQEKEISVLEAINKRSNISQRGIAAEADISIGKANAIIKQLLEQEYIRIDRIQNKQKYIVTEKGLSQLEAHIKEAGITKIEVQGDARRKISTAVILSAGECPDFDDPIGALKLGDKTVMERLLKLLQESGIEKIVIVTGYKSSYYDKFRDGKHIFTVENSLYKGSGTMTSLAMAKDYIDDDFLLLEGDLAFEKSALAKVLEAPKRDCILITSESGSGDEVFVEIRNEFLFKMSKDRHQFNRIDGEMIGICKISIDIYKKMLEEFKSNSNPYLNYEYMLFDIARTYNISYVKINDLIWSEIDTKWHYRNLIKFIFPMIVKKESGNSGRDTNGKS